MCLKTVFVFYYWWSCSSHLTSQSDSIAQDQAIRLYGRLDNHYPEPIVVGADFNLESSQVPGVWNTDYLDADENSSPRQVTTDGGESIDYIWALDSVFNHLFGVAEVTSANVNSDHHVVHGAFVWP